MTSALNIVNSIIHNTADKLIVDIFNCKNRYQIESALGCLAISEGGLAQAITEPCLRFNIGARIYLDEIIEKNNITKTAALFSQTQARILVSVGREDDVKFVGLCEQRNIPLTRIGVTDTDPTLEIQDLATWQLTDLKSALDATLPELFA